MKNRVLIVICYFGKLPDTMGAFLYSCEKNEDFNWIIFTDCDVKNAPQNVRIEKTTFSKIKELAEEKLKMKISYETPYKSCDYRPAYGLIFEDYLKGYDFFGWGDLDVIYGDLKHFITDDILDRYEKVYWFGHLSLIRNNDICCKLFYNESNSTMSYKHVFSSSQFCFFDEDRGINNKILEAGLQIYAKYDFADIDGAYKRFRNVNKTVLKLTLPNFKHFDGLRKNYKHQIFYYREGHLYHRYIKNKSIIDEEICYIHYRRKLKVFWRESDSVMLISPIGLIGTNAPPNIEDIDKYNGIAENEGLVFLKFVSHRIRIRAKAVLKDRIILLFGKSQVIRCLARKLRDLKKKAEEEKWQKN